MLNLWTNTLIMETKTQAEIYNNYKSISDEWWHHNMSQLNNDRLRNLVMQIQWNKSVIKGFKLTSNDLEIHRNRMDRFLIELENINKILKEVNYNYTPKRIEIIKQSILKLKKYDN